jgi:hypothetical protein
MFDAIHGTNVRKISIGSIETVMKIMNYLDRRLLLFWDIVNL